MDLVTVHSSGEVIVAVLGGSTQPYYNKAKQLRYTRALFHKLIDLWDHVGGRATADQTDNAVQLNLTQDEELMMHSVHP
ncbi:hypothetical protein D0860_05470 [Hortaea werneckii]|uniref:Uncharacterized protein n=1 Tax=Hortaea werneckii TaxID=91943 RepID=A0A3M7H047_HORWE|nr:hypothetical protein D0860_05470 [Hortaea werneckii]